MVYIINIIEKVLDLIKLLLLVRIIISWLPIGRNSFTTIIYNLTEPFLSPIRELLNKSPLGKGLMVDFSPLILFLILDVLKRILYSVLISSLF